MRGKGRRRAMAERATQPDRPQAKPGWTETDSKRFIDDGAVFVPSREEQIATLCGLIPARADEAFTVVELVGGALLLADVVEPVSPAAREAFARQWEDAARAQSLALTGGLEAFERFQRDGWNFYRGTPDPIDQPSRLDEQLRWLKAAGFATVDCVWMRAGHAIFGGWGPRNGPQTPNARHAPAKPGRSSTTSRRGR